MADFISFSIVTADGIAFEADVSYINIPTDGGSIGILPGHIALLCAMDAGIVRCTRVTGETVRIEVKEGVADIKGGSVSILCSGAAVI